MLLIRRLGSWLRPLFHLGHNPITLTGAVLTTSSALILVGYWALEILRGGPTHPYIGILLFLGLPGVFVLGLLLMPTGVLLRRRRLAKRGELPESYPRIDLGRPVWRQALAWVGVATVVNVAILGTASYKGVEYMDSSQFCGLSCHSVMAPEHTAYVDSPHARVSCVECHIGPGANWFVRSKLSGARQVLAVAFDTHSRPIPSPVRELRPARETCEHCHWPRKFHGDKLVVKTKFADDETNTRLVSVLMLRIGGQAGHGRTGIHGRHLDQSERIRYVSDSSRQTIPRVTYLDDDGKSVEYVSEDAPAAGAPEATEARSMDCMDCHNRPTHAFELPERAVDRAMLEGRISTELPFVKKKAIELLRTEYPDRDQAAARIVEGLGRYYEQSHPEIWRQQREKVEAAGARLREIYLRNVFPQMKVAWGTYPNNVGHEDFPGCFRCHDDKHKSRDGRVISQDCNACHAVLAMEESDPKILQDLGLR